jgi:two-component system sensor histidine kinase KdpD
MRLPAVPSVWPALFIWLLVTCGLFLLDGWWSLGNLALLLVLGSTLASFWLSTSTCVLLSALAVAGFNWFFVAPRYTFHVQLNQDLLLLATLLGTSTVISVLTSRLRQHAQQQTEQARHAEHLQLLGTKLQHANNVAEQLHVTIELLQSWTHQSVRIWLQDQPPRPDEPLHRAWQASQQELGAIGPGTGRHESMHALVLPLRAGVERIGTLALGPLSSGIQGGVWPPERLQALAHLVADEVQRLQSDLLARKAQEKLQTQQLRNTLLAAISHDYRTPLATIASAASGLQACADARQMQQAALTILEETEHLHRMTTNTLQMARLDMHDAPLHGSWESVEELCGAALAATRRRHGNRHLLTDVASGLPLLWCDPVLVVQLLDNLLENALRYSPDSEPVSLQAKVLGHSVQMTVLDRGIGIPAAWRERVFDPFRRVLPETQGDTGFAHAQRRGMGLGLALCQAIARVHGARLWIEDRPGSGTQVCIRFAPQDQPSPLPETTPEESPP